MVVVAAAAAAAAALVAMVVVVVVVVHGHRTATKKTTHNGLNARVDEDKRRRRAPGAHRCGLEREAHAVDLGAGRVVQHCGAAVRGRRRVRHLCARHPRVRASSVEGQAAHTMRRLP